MNSDKHSDKNKATRATFTDRTFLLCQYFAVLVNTSLFLKFASIDGAVTAGFMVAATLSYASAYWLVIAIVNSIAALTLGSWKASTALPRWKPTLHAAITVSASAAMHVLLHLDRFVFGVFGFHINSFVVNLLTTPGGAESMDVGSSAKVTFAAIIAAIVAANIALWFFAAWLNKRRKGISKKKLAVAAALVLVCIITQGLGYGAAKVFGKRHILRSAQALPWYQPVSISSWARKHGIKPKETNIKTVDTNVMLNYPKEPLGQITRPLNIVWLVGESWRFDMLTEEISPNISKFAEENAAVFTNHYSSGVNTRMGMFGMFYGLHGNYWFSMLPVRRSPVMIDALQQYGYDFLFRTSSRFTYPEFNQTILANIDPANIFERSEVKQGWKLDRENVGEICQWITQHNNTSPDKPFMTFMFFESPHAGYHFPEEAEIRSDYDHNFNYATDLSDSPSESQRQGIFNRYVNASHHMDMQIGRIIDTLTENNLLENTIVVITGDHGEEFHEISRWGHGGSDFHEYQIRVPLVLYVPQGLKGRFDGKTSHTDLPATILNALGVDTSPATYSFGENILTGHVGRPTIVVSAWDHMMCRTDTGKVIFPFRSTGLTSCATPYDRPVDDEDEIISKNAGQLANIVRQMRYFAK